MPGETNLGRLTAYLELENREWKTGIDGAMKDLREFDERTTASKRALDDLAAHTGIAASTIKKFTTSMSESTFTSKTMEAKAAMDQLAESTGVSAKAIESFVASQQGAQTFAARLRETNAAATELAYKIGGSVSALKEFIRVQSQPSTLDGKLKAENAALEQFSVQTGIAESSVRAFIAAENTQSQFDAKLKESKAAIQEFSQQMGISAAKVKEMVAAENGQSGGLFQSQAIAAFAAKVGIAEEAVRKLVAAENELTALAEKTRAAQAAISEFSAQTGIASAKVKDFLAAEAMQNMTFEERTKANEAALQAFATKTGVATNKLREFAEAEQMATAEGGAGGGGGMGSFFEGIGAKIFFFIATLEQAGAAVKEFYSFLEEGARASAAEEFFQRAGNSINEMRLATKGLISDVELMKKTNLAENMGIDAKGVETLALVAHTAALKTGQSFDYMFDRIVQGTARSSRVILGHMGIMVSMKEAQEHYAEELQHGADAGEYANKTIQQLTASMSDEEKHHAYLEEVIRKSQKPLEDYAAVGSTGADNFDRFTASMSNLKVVVAELIGQGANSTIGKLALALTDIANTLKTIKNFSSAGALEQGVLGAVGGAASSVAGTIANHPLASLFWGGIPLLNSAIMGAVSGAGTGVSQDAVANQAKTSNLFDAQSKSLKGLGINLDYLASATDVQTKQLAEANQINVDFLKNWQAVNRLLDNVYGTHGVLAAPKEEGDPKTGKTKVGKKGSADIDGILGDLRKYDLDGWNKELQRQLDGFEKAVNVIDVAKLEYRFKKGEETWEDVAGLFIDAPDALRDIFDKIGHRIEEKAAQASASTDSLIDKVQGLLDKTIDGYIQGFSNLAQGAASGSASQGITAIGTIIGTFMGAPAAGTAIGQFIAPLLAPLKPLADLFSYLAKGIAGLISIGLGPLLNTLEPLGPALDVLLKAVGLVVESALKPLIPLMFLLAQGVAYAVTFIADLLIGLSPVIEAFVDIFLFGIGILNEFFMLIVKMFNPSFNIDSISLAFQQVANTMIDFAVWLNNVVVRAFRKIPGMDNFGTVLDKKDFEVDSLNDNTAATKDNTSASAANTQAVRDLAREFRNLPSGYKINYPIYESTAPRTRGFIPPHLQPPNIRDFFRGRT